MYYELYELKNAVMDEPTDENINALADWLQVYGRLFWRKKYFDLDDFRLYPLYEKVDGEIEITGWELD